LRGFEEAAAIPLDCFAGLGMTGKSMRRFVPAITLFLAACATAPQQPVPQVQQPRVITPSRPERTSSLVGLTASELVGHFGNPALQVREGTSLKLQFRGPRCVLDAYLYPPPAGGMQRVTYVDTRSPSGADTDQLACISALETPSPR
jgi:hypothetical protein